jgi:hypothetical protein
MRRLISLAFVVTVLGASVGLPLAATYDLPRVPMKGSEGPDIRAKIPPKAVEGPDIRNALAPRVPVGLGTR